MVNQFFKCRNIYTSPICRIGQRQPHTSKSKFLHFSCLPVFIRCFLTSEYRIIHGVYSKSRVTKRNLRSAQLCPTPGVGSSLYLEQKKKPGCLSAGLFMSINTSFSFLSAYPNQCETNGVTTATSHVILRTTEAVGTRPTDANKGAQTLCPFSIQFTVGTAVRIGSRIYSIINKVVQCRASRIHVCINAGRVSNIIAVADDILIKRETG